MLLDQNLWIPSNSDVGRQAKLALQYTSARTTKQNPTGISRLYAEREGYVLAPRHYLDLAEVQPEWIGPRSYPTLDDRCSITPWGRTPDEVTIQKDAFSFLADYGQNPAEADSIVSLRCGGGKTCIGLRGAFDLGYHTVIVAHTQDILNNWYEEIRAHTTVTDVGRVISGEYELRPVTLALIQSVLALPEERLHEMSSRFGTVLLDEMHHLSGTEFSKVGNAFSGRRIGLSATLAREDGLSFVYYLALGRRVFFRETVRKRADVFFRRIAVDDLDFPDNYARATTALALSSQYLAAIESDVRQAYASQHKQILLSSRVEVTNALAARLQDLHPGVNTADTRAEIRHQNIRTKPIVIATDSLGKEGLNEPGLTQLRVVTPVRDSNAIAQMVGRLERGDTVMEAYFYAARHRAFQNTLHRAKEALVRHQYFVQEA